MLLLLVHELGHYVGAPVFIPFVGAWIQLKDMPHDTEAYVGLGGPLAGTVASLACYFAARSTGIDLLLALSYAGFFINLFNLIPLSPFDGGRITAVLSPRIWLMGVPVLVALFFWRPSPILILAAVLAFPNVLRAFKYDPVAAREPGLLRHHAGKQADLHLRLPGPGLRAGDHGTRRARHAGAPARLNLPCLTVATAEAGAAVTTASLFFHVTVIAGWFHSQA